MKNAIGIPSLIAQDASSVANSHFKRMRSVGAGSAYSRADLVLARTLCRDSSDLLCKRAPGGVITSVKRFCNAGIVCLRLPAAICRSIISARALTGDPYFLGRSPILLLEYAHDRCIAIRNLPCEKSRRRARSRFWILASPRRSPSTIAPGGVE